MNVQQQLRELFRPVLLNRLNNQDECEELLSMIRVASDAKHGDYQANFAMPLAKRKHGTNPRELASEFIKEVSATPMVEALSVAGPGFINIRLSNSWLTSTILSFSRDERLGVQTVDKPRTFVVDYSSPNVAKPLHVGHLRSTIIGDAITRLLRFLGHRVITDNHLGDWGTQFGMLIHGYRNHLDETAYANDPVRELARLYILVRSQFRKGDDDTDTPESDDPVKLACQQETAKLHRGDPENVKLWKEFMPHCLEMIDIIYRRLGILPFDFQHGESFYNPMLAAVVTDMLSRGIAFESQGAVVIPNANGVIPQTPEEQQREEPPAILRKRDGAFTYTTSDLATVKYRMDTFHPDAILYAVDSRQALHFKTFFAQARRWGYKNVELTHISFGSVLGEDRKPFAARKGGAPELSELIEEAIANGLKKYNENIESRKASGREVPELSEQQKSQIAEVVGIGAIKYADLCQNRNSDYVFSYDKMMSTEGNTATYMQYAYARCRSILRKSGHDAKNGTQPQFVLIENHVERMLILQILRFEETLHAASQDYFPHLITTYLWDLAKVFSVFFDSCPVLTAETNELRASRLLLVELTSRVIRQALELLGIQTVEQM